MSEASKHIVIDLGNTKAKLGVFEDGLLQHKYDDVKFDKLIELADGLEAQAAIISTVNQNAEQLSRELKCRAIVLDHLTALPIINKYATPETLGKDRLAGAVAASALFPNENCLVIDIGTCITYDFITYSAEYLGGSISPGVDLKFKALHNFTAHLPLVEDYGVPELIGDTTKSAIRSGVINGTVAEIEEIIRMYKDKFSHLRIIICGGGASELKNRLKTEIKLETDLVLIGLNRILEYNV